MSMNKIVAKKISALADEIKADSDYVYDPQHKNRPHGGGTWYKTEKGWSTYEPPSNKTSKGLDWSNRERAMLKIVQNPNATKDELWDVHDYIYDALDADNPKRKELEKNLWSNRNLDRNLIKDEFNSIENDLLGYEDDEYHEQMGKLYSENQIMLESLAKNSATPYEIEDKIRQMKGWYDFYQEREKKRNEKTYTVPWHQEIHERLKDDNLSLKKLDQIATKIWKKDWFAEDLNKVNEKEMTDLLIEVYNHPSMASDQISKDYRGVYNASGGNFDYYTSDEVSRLLDGMVLNNPKAPRGLRNQLKIQKEKKSLTPEEWNEFAQDEDWEVRRDVAYYTEDQELLNKLSKDGNWKVRTQVARNISDPEVLDNLSKDENSSVRISVSYNNSTPSETLKRLRQDNDPDVREAAERHYRYINSKNRL